MSQELNFQQILNLVNESNKEFQSSVYIPSLKREVEVKPMNAAHLKNIIKASVSGIFANNSFNQEVRKILRDVLPDTTNINILDKIAILVQLRVLNLSDKINLELTYLKKSKTQEIDLTKVVEKIKALNEDFKDVIIEDKNCEVTLNYPSIDTENLFDRNFEETKIKTLDENDKEAVKELFGPLFIQELAQYIKLVKIKDSVIDFSTMKASERLAVMEILPSGIVTKIIEKIDTEFGKKITDITSVEEVINEKPYKGKIPINATLFT